MGVSMAALLYRAKELKLVSKRNHNRLIFELAPSRRQEPACFDVPVEQPRGPRQMAEVLYGLTLVTTDLALPGTFIGDVLGRYASEQDIAESTKRRKSSASEVDLNHPHTLED